jgi:hypothetical protein
LPAITSWLAIFRALGPEELLRHFEKRPET